MSANEDEDDAVWAGVRHEHEAGGEDCSYCALTYPEGEQRLPAVVVGGLLEERWRTMVGLGFERQVLREMARLGLVSE